MHFLECGLSNLAMTPSPAAYSWQWRRRHIFQRQWSVSLVLGLTPNSLQAFYIHFWQLLNLKRSLSKQSCKCQQWQNWRGEHAISWRFAAAIATSSLNGRLFTYGYTIMSRTFLWKQPHPFLIIWAQAGGLRKCTARSYCTACRYSTFFKGNSSFNFK